MAELVDALVLGTRVLVAWEFDSPYLYHIWRCGGTWHTQLPQKEPPTGIRVRVPSALPDKGEIMKSVKEMVKGGKKVTFSYFYGGDLWYKTECGFEFPVPVEDTSGAVFRAEDKAILFMRWIRKHVAFVEAFEAESQRLLDTAG